MFDFLKRKSYKIEEENGTKKVVAKKYSEADFDSYIEQLNSDKEMLERIIKALGKIKAKFEDDDDIPDYMKNKIKGPVEYDFKEEDKIIKLFESLNMKPLAEEVNKISKDTDKAQQVSNEETSDLEDKTTSTDTEGSVLDLFNTGNTGGSTTKTEGQEQSKQDLEKAASLKRSADLNPGSSKYRAEGIKERLLEINKEVINVKTPGVTYVGGVGKDVITPGPKSTLVRVTEETVRPNNVVQNVKIKIMRDEGTKERLLPDHNIKMPVGDTVVRHANESISIKGNPTPEEEKQIDEILKKEGETPESKQQQLNNKNLGGKASLYNTVMSKIFAETNEEDIEINEEVENKKTPTSLQEALDNI